MSGTIYSEKTYGGTVCTGPIYGVETDVSNNVGGNISNIQEWVGNIELTSNVIILDGAAVVISCDANVRANGYTIIVKSGGYLNTRTQRLPRNSAIGSIIIIT